MDWKQEAAQRLKKLDALRQSESSLERELESLLEEQKAVKNTLRQIQSQVAILEEALQVLNPEERLVADQLFVYPQRGNVQRLCQILNVEQSSIYRRRDRVLEKVSFALFGK